MSLRIVRNDIARERVDAIVTLPHFEPQVGVGVDSSVHKAAGPKLLLARKSLGVISPGDAWTTDAYNLKAKYVIHGLGPIFTRNDENERQLLETSYGVILREAIIHGCKSIAIPLLSSGEFGFSSRIALKHAVIAIKKFLAHYGEDTIDVHLVVFTADAYTQALNHYREITSSSIDDKKVDEILARRDKNEAKKQRASRMATAENGDGYYADVALRKNPHALVKMLKNVKTKFVSDERNRLRRDKHRGKDIEPHGDDVPYVTSTALMAQEIFNRRMAQWREGMPTPKKPSKGYLDNLFSGATDAIPAKPFLDEIANVCGLGDDDRDRLMRAAGY